MELTLALQGVAAQGPPRWRLQLDLLGDPNFALDVKAELDCMSRLSGRNWESLATSSAMERWLRLKHRIGEMARSHGRRRRVAAQAQRAALQQQVLHAAAAHAGPARPSGQPLPPGGAGAPPLSAAAAARNVRTAAARLRAFDLASAGRDVAKADAAWHTYGEKPTFWFHRLGESRIVTPPMSAVKDPQTGAVVTADCALSARRGAEIAADFFDGDKPDGLFAPAQTDATAQQEIFFF